MGFFLWRRSCVSSPSAGGGGRLLLSLFWCAAQQFPGAPAVFYYVSCSWLPFWGSTPRCLRLADLLLQWRFSVGLGVSWYRCPVTPLGFLPCASAAPPSAASPSGFCALDRCVSMSDSSLLVYSWGWVGGIFAAPLGFLPCAVLFLRACSVRCFPCCRFPWGFQVTGCLSFCFPGDVGWASALPFFFYASPAPLACRGSRGYAPCVRVLPLR